MNKTSENATKKKVNKNTLMQRNGEIGHANLRFEWWLQYPFTSIKLSALVQTIILCRCCVSFFKREKGNTTNTLP